MSSNFAPPEYASAAELADAARSWLADRGVDGAALDARLLLLHASGLSAIDLLAGGRDTALGPDAVRRFCAMVMRRGMGEPVARIFGKRAFWDADFIVTPDVLDPRPDTETLVETALELLPENGRMRILDVGTGSGCIVLVLLRERPQAVGVALDASKAALDVARLNAALLGLERRMAFVESHWFEALEGAGESRSSFDLIVSNPPYIPSADIASLDREVREHDPLVALDGGPDGLDAYRELAQRSPDWLVPGGAVALEVGIGQADAVAGLLVEAGFGEVAIRKDLSGIKRCVYGRPGTV